MGFPTKLLALVEGMLSQEGPATAGGLANAGAFVGLGADGRLDTTLFKAPAVVAYAASIAYDLAANMDVQTTLTGNVTLANPASLTPGNSGAIMLIQDSTGSRLLSAAGTAWQFPGGVLPVLSTAPGAVDVLFYKAWSSTQILCAAQLGFAA